MMGRRCRPTIKVTTYVDHLAGDDGGGRKGGAEKEGSRQIARITAFDIASKFRIPKQELLLGFILEA